VNRDVAAVLAESLARGERVARATVVTPHNGERELLIWPAGHTFGDLGWPRLNQRVALYAEQLFEKGPREMAKEFDLPDGTRVDVRFEFPHLA
jgi:hypothetical protein